MNITLSFSLAVPYPLNSLPANHSSILTLQVNSSGKLSLSNLIGAAGWASVNPSVCFLHCGCLWHRMCRPAPSRCEIWTRLQMENPGLWFALSFLPIHSSMIAEGSHTYTWTLQPLQRSSTQHPVLRLLAPAMHSPGRV